MIRLHYFIFFILLQCATVQAYGQRMGYVDKQLILSKMPEYQTVKEELNKVAEQHQTKIEALGSKLDRMTVTYHLEEVMFTEAMREKKRKELATIKQELKAYQKRIYGIDGLLSLKENELMKPLKDKLNEALQRIAKKNNLGIIFDKQQYDLTFFYASYSSNYTNKVLELMELTTKDNEEKR